MTKQELLDKLSKISGYQKSKERVKTCNGNFLAFLDNADNLKMTSYSHWSFLQMIDGVYVFNHYSYSVTTSKHQNLGRRILRELGIEYIDFSTRNSLGNYDSSLDKILESKVKSLYAGENALATSRATKYAVYSEDSWNETIKEIKILQAALKMSDKKLGELMIKEELAATEALLDAELDAYIRKTSRQEANKENQSLEAIQL